MSVSYERYSAAREKVSPAAAKRTRGIALGLSKTRAQLQSVHERSEVYGIGTVYSIMVVIVPKCVAYSYLPLPHRKLELMNGRCMYCSQN